VGTPPAQNGRREQRRGTEAIQPHDTFSFRLLKSRMHLTSALGRRQRDKPSLDFQTAHKQGRSGPRSQTPNALLFNRIVDLSGNQSKPGAFALFGVRWGMVVTAAHGERNGQTVAIRRRTTF
jgi:hypothetical protein